jgi:putative ABC transport system ATP-binding protein
MAQETTLISLKDVSLSFKTAEEIVVAVETASVTIPKGMATVIFGPSGSGKSSLLNMLSGLQAPSTGLIEYDGVDLYSNSANKLAFFRAHELGIVYQTNYWVKSLNVLENVSLPLYFLGHSKQQAAEKAMQALTRVSMQEFAGANPSLLSGGEQQRIAMARAIVFDPPVIIADEPTGNLDSKNGDMIINLLNDLRNKQGKTVILVTHNMEYLYIADHLIEIQDGTVKEIDRSDIKKTVGGMLTDARKRINKLMDTPK